MAARCGEGRVPKHHQITKLAQMAQSIKMGFDLSMEGANYLTFDNFDSCFGVSALLQIHGVQHKRGSVDAGPCSRKAF